MLELERKEVGGYWCFTYEAMRLGQAQTILAVVCSEEIGAGVPKMIQETNKKYTTTKNQKDN